MNETIKKQCDHRSIREFTEEAVSKEHLEQIYAAAQRTASSMGLQNASIIRITDPAIKKTMAEIATQEYVGRAPELWVFICDVFRNTQIAKEKGEDPKAGFGMDFFIQGFTDAVLMAQNCLTAIESLGLGGVFIGNVLNDPKKVIELLKLPKGTFPVVGMLFGHPNQSPQLKPRMAMKFRVFENSYNIEESYLEVLKDYDEEMHTYYDLRDANRRVDTFSDQVAKKMTNWSPLRQEVLKAVEENGFTLNLDQD